MFLSDVLKKEECREEALKLLRKLGVKSAPKKLKQHSIKGQGGKVFKVPLRGLPITTVTLPTGQQMVIPKLIHELCSRLSREMHTEGIFRKEGSKAKQNEIKATLDRGDVLDPNAHVIDVACILKLLLRELPEAIIPYSHHDVFLRSTLLNSDIKTEALLLCCLLLPTENLNTLTYLMQFFQKVAEQSSRNKMTVSNLAIVIGPAIFPIEERLPPDVIQTRAAKIREIMETLIANASELGILPENVIAGLGANEDLRRKKRRSGSLTRMFNGLRKIVGAKSVEETHNVVIPDLLLTPISSNMVKKRKIQAKVISKKKRDLLHNLPDNALVRTPFTPSRTPVSMNLSGTQDHLKDMNGLKMEKKSQWFSRSRSVKNLNQGEPTSKRNLERRWSALGQASNNLNKIKRNSSVATSLCHKTDQKIDEHVFQPDYIRVSKTEYEEIKNRLSEMEKRISMELDSVQLQVKKENDKMEMDTDNNIKKVQAVYEQTLVKSTQLSPGTDHLAKRLSRELKIRKSNEQKIIRSPSARKIGSMRRKSREIEKNDAKLIRHQSWHAASQDATRRSIKRGKPNTVLTGLPINRSDETLETKGIKATRFNFFGDQSGKSVCCNLSGSSTDTWVSAEGFFATLKSNNDSNSVTGRASLAKLRNLNAGMVMAKAKLFDKLTDSDSSNSNNLTRSMQRAKAGTKIGSNRNADARVSYRVRSLKYEEKKFNKKSVSPRRRNAQLSQKHKLQITKQYLELDAKKNSDKENFPESVNGLDKSSNLPFKDCNRIDPQKILSPKFSTPRSTPHIKQSLGVKSPKRLCRKSVGVQRSTPLKVLKTPVHNKM